MLTVNEMTGALETHTYVIQVTTHEKWTPETVQDRWNEGIDRSRVTVCSVRASAWDRGISTCCPLAFFVPETPRLAFDNGTQQHFMAGRLFNDTREGRLSNSALLSWALVILHGHRPHIRRKFYAWLLPYNLGWKAWIKWMEDRPTPGQVWGLSWEGIVIHFSREKNARFYGLFHND